jgi:hypothetical protein
VEIGYERIRARLGNAVDLGHEHQDLKFERIHDFVTIGAGHVSL